MQKNLVRNIVFVAVLLVTGIASGQGADQGVADDPALGEARLLLQAGREDIIRDEIRFTDSESVAFWPAYDNYRNDVLMVRNRHADLVVSYLEAYRAGSISEKFAERLVNDYLDIKNDLLKIQKKHLKKFRKALPARKVARFYQLENKLDAELEAQLAHFVPLIDPV